MPERDGDLAALADAMANLDAFHRVGVALEVAEYALVVGTTQRAGVVVVETELFWFNERLDQARYELPAGSAQQLANVLVEDLRTRRLLATDFLHMTLQSSRYAEELSAASEIGAFEFAGLEVLHNPLFGASLRYRHQFYENVRADVFVYPVPHWQPDAPERLDDEMTTVRRDLRRLEEGGFWRELTLGAVRTLQVAGAGRVLACEGDFRTDQDLLTTTAYVYVLGDKFVKVRASFAKFTPVREDIENFVLTLPASLETPGESPFMARRRNAWRAADQDS